MRSGLWIIFCVIVSINLSLSQDVLDESQQFVNDGLLDFTVRLNSILSSKNVNNKNILFSPINLYTALALIHLGSNGTTQNQISGVMGVPKNYPPETLHEVLLNFTTVAQSSTKKRAYLANGTRSNVRVCDLNLANGIFVQRGFKLKQSYVENAQLYYNSEIIDVDFVNESKQATDTINKYVANKTENRIPQLFRDPQSPNTRVILASTLYFKSVWLYKFNKSLTYTDTFYTEDGNVSVPMMYKLLNTPYANISSLGVEAVNLKFADQAFCMFVVKPYENLSLNEILSNLTADDIRTIVNETTRDHRVDLKFPTTAFKWSQSIKEELGQLGLSKVFNDDADLGSMFEKNNIKIDQISHSTDIKINEDGTEASAVTPIVMVLKIGGRPKDVLFHLNRPFFFFIYHRRINTVLFLGSVHNPKGT